MPKVQIAATELVSMDVNRVSLVKRGSSRLPFRLLKEDNEQMLDFGKVNLDRLFKTGETTPVPAVVAVLVNKTADSAAVEAAIKEAGLDVTDKSEKDGVIVYTQKGEDQTDLGMVKLSDDVAVAVSHVKKGFSSYDYENTSFGEVIKTSGFYPAIRMATEAVNEVVYAVMHKADTPSEAATALTKVADDFKNYLTALTQALPERAFKMEKAETERLAKSASKPKDKKDDKNDAPEGKKTPAKKDDETPEAKAAREKEEAEAAEKAKLGKTDNPATITLDGTGQLPGGLADMLKGIMIDATKDLREDFKKSGDELRTDLNAVRDSVKTLSTSVKKAEEAISGTVHVDADDDNDTTTRTRKSEVDNSAPPPLLDTAISRLPTRAERRAAAA